MQGFPGGVQEVLDCLPPVGAAAAAGDVNGDGRDDLFLTSSARGTECALYLAGPDGRFTDTTAAAGLLGLNDDLGIATGAALADVDTDGDPDLYVVRWGPNVLCLNRGDGTFDRVPGAAADPGNGAAAVFFDADLDGDPDLYVANLLPDVPILSVDRLDPPAAGLHGARNGGTNRLFRNDGGRFVDVTTESGSGDTGWSITAAAGDVDGDGDPDLLVGNVYGPLRVYRNDGGCKFTPDGGCFRGSCMSLGIDLGDVNEDLRDDILVTGLGHPRGAVERSRLWLGRAGGRLEEAGGAAGLGLVFRAAGARFVDIDLDGDLDILFANGFDPVGSSFEALAARWVRLDSLGSETPLARFRFPGSERAGRWCVAWNDRGTFTPDREGGTLAGPGCGASLLDVDGDGRLDAYVACQGAEGTLLLNRTENRNCWIDLELFGRDGRAAALGARATVQGQAVDAAPSGLLVARSLGASGGSCPEASRRLHFGVGDRDAANVQIVWPGGTVQIQASVPAGRVHRLVQPEANPEPGDPLLWAPADSLENAVFAFESASRRRPTDFQLAADYREYCLRNRLYARALRFFRELRGPLPVTLALHRVLTHADGVGRMQEDILVRGASAAMALVEAGELIRAYPDFWTAERLRALNYLYWPVEFDQLPRCMADYRRCIEIGAQEGGSPPHRVQVFLELGDAYAKAGRVEEAIATWRRGQELDASEAAFAERAAIPRERVQAVVSELRDLDRPPATRIPWIEAEMLRKPLRAERARAAAGAAAWNASGPACMDPWHPDAASGRERHETLGALLARLAREPDNLVTHMLVYGRALAQVEGLLGEARRGSERPGPEAVRLARGWLQLRGALTVEQVTAAQVSLAASARRLAGRDRQDPRRGRLLLLAQLGMGDAENLLGRLESGYKAWRVREDLFDAPVVARRVYIPIDQVEQEVWSPAFGHGVLDPRTLEDLRR